MNDPSAYIRFLIVAGAALYAAATALYCFSRRRAGHAALGVGCGVNFVLFVVNWRLAGEPPFGNMYHVHVFLALCFPPLYLLLSRRDGLAWAGGYFAAAALLALVGAWFMDPNVHWRRMPALQSPWFVPHVFAYMVSYALAVVAFIMTVVKWCTRSGPERRARYRATARRIIRVGFPFMTFGMLSGALWAEEAWGVYWSWDPKETWSLITWTGYLAYLHCGYDRKAAAWADVAQTFAFLALLWTFFLVNLMPGLASALHSYAS
jgi:ABC-type transport system involved in cytochrome c biogenesis permease subunit